MISLKLLLQIPSFVIALIGMVLLSIAMATPAWQVVYAREIQQWIHSGLWMNCQTRPTGTVTCTYTFTKNDLNFYSNAQLIDMRTPVFYEWQHNLLYILFVAQLFALFAILCFCYSQTSSVGKNSALLFTVMIGLSALINIGCNVTFQAFAHMVAYRFYTVSVSGIYEKHVGYSYYLHLIGSLMLILSFLLSLGYLLLIYRTNHHSMDSANASQPHQVHHYRLPNEDLLAMRALPELPTKYR